MEFLRANTRVRAAGVDRESGIIRGVILAEEGPFKTEGRGEFDEKSIDQIVKLSNAQSAGLKSRFSHPDLSNDGLGKYLGRVRNIRKEFQQTEDGREIALARGDQHFAKSAFDTPSGDLAGYIMTLAEEDPDALGMSLVLKTDEEFRLDEKKRPVTDDDGEPLPPLWRPTSLHAADFVDTGDATNSLLVQSLAFDGLPDDVVRQAEKLLRQQFAGKSRVFVEEHLNAWVGRVLSHYWPEDEQAQEMPAEDLARMLSLRNRNLDTKTEVS